jgi:tRNA(Ile)-lysidine synthase TilS/MesJ
MKYVASCSFGKDSIATVILAHLHNEPLDLIVFSEVMFDENISGEHPLHIDFIYNKAIPILKVGAMRLKS